MEGQKCVVLSDKREILLNDESDIVLSVVSNGKTKFTFEIPYPLEGYGGGTLLLSLSEKYLLFSYYSGQSEEAFLLQTLRTGWWYESEAETDKNGNRFYEFGEINILNIMKKKFNKHRVQIYPSSDWKEEVTDEGDFLISKIVNDDIISVIMPWGEETLALPLKDIIIFKPE